MAVWAQTDCDAGNGTLNSDPPKTLTVQHVIEKLGEAESEAYETRRHYSYKQDVLMQTLSGKNVTGEFHEVTTVSYDASGKRKENVTFAAQSSLRGIQLTQQDMEDIRVFMPLMLTKDELPRYELGYTGQQHVDDLDTYVFRVDPKKFDPKKADKMPRYFQGQIWVDAQDFQIVKVCGKSGPDRVRVKKKQRADLHPMFVTYRQQVDGQNWFPAFTRSDDTLEFPTGPAHLKEVIKYTDYRRTEGR
jgi:hypothetical protein